MDATMMRLDDLPSHLQRNGLIPPPRRPQWTGQEDNDNGSTGDDAEEGWVPRAAAAQHAFQGILSDQTSDQCDDETVKNTVVRYLEEKFGSARAADLRSDAKALRDTDDADILEAILFHDAVRLSADLEKVDLSDAASRWDDAIFAFRENNVHVAHAIRLLGLSVRCTVPSLRRKAEEVKRSMRSAEARIDDRENQCDDAFTAFDDLCTGWGLNSDWPEDKLEEGLTSLPDRELGGWYDKIEGAVHEDGIVAEAVSYYRRFAPYVRGADDGGDASSNDALVPTLSRFVLCSGDDNDGGDPEESAKRDGGKPLSLSSPAVRTGLVVDLKEVRSFVMARSKEIDAEKKGRARGGGAAGALMLASEGRDTGSGAAVGTMPHKSEEDLSRYRPAIESALTHLSADRFVVLTLLAESDEFRQRRVAELKASLERVMRRQDERDDARVQRDALGRKLRVMEDDLDRYKIRIEEIRAELEREVVAILGEDVSIVL